MSTPLGVCSRVWYHSIATSLMIFVVIVYLCGISNGIFESSFVRMVALLYHNTISLLSPCAMILC